jgi:hypothetical protein
MMEAKRSRKMEITCYNCKNIWEVPAGTMRRARLEYALGHEDFSFVCPNCGAKNGLTADEFHSNDHPQIVVPVTGVQSQPAEGTKERSMMNETAGSAPTNPIEAPKPGPQSRQAIIRARGVEARRDHSYWSEVMGGFSQGETVTIVDTWTDGEHTWVQLGPERWVNIEQDGEPVFNLLD